MCRSCKGTRHGAGDVEQRAAEEARLAARAGRAKGREVNASTGAAEQVPRYSVGIFDEMRRKAAIAREGRELATAVGGQSTMGATRSPTSR